MSDTATPIRLRLKRDSQLEIDWADGTSSVYPIAYLRGRCPCAQCRQEREVRAQSKSRLSVLKGDFSKPLSVVGAEKVGNYALKLTWSDNHASGIYAFDYLREIAPASTN